MVEIKTQLKAECCFTYKLILHIQLALNTVNYSRPFPVRRTNKLNSIKICSCQLLICVVLFTLIKKKSSEIYQKTQLNVFPVIYQLKAELG